MPKARGGVALPVTEAAGITAVVAALAILLASLGTSARDAVLLALAIAIQAAAGTYWWRRLDPAAPARSVLERWGLGLALGSALSLLAGIVLSLVVPWDWWWLSPAALAALDVLARRSREAQAPASAPAGPVLAFLAGTLASIAALVPALARYPLDGSGAVTTYHADMVFFEAIGTGVARYGAGDSALMAGEAIRYHWFAYAWVGQLGSSLGTEPFAALTRALPIVAIGATLAIVAGWTSRLSASRIGPWLAVGLVATGGYVGAVNGTVLNLDSPSQALTTAWLVAFAVAMLGWLAGRGAPWSLALPAVLTIALVGGKVSAAAVGLGGVAAVTVAAAVRRDPWAWRAWALAGATGAAALMAYAAVIAGNASSGDLLVWDLGRRASTLQGLDSSPLPRGVVLGTVALAVAMACRWAGFAGLSGSRAWRWRPETMAGWGYLAAGVLPLAIFSQGLNETWFALSTSAPLAVLSATGVVVLWRAASLPRWAAGITIVAAGAGSLLVALVWTGRYWEAGLGRFFAPWVALAVATIAGAATLASIRHRRFRAAAAVAIACLVLQGAAGRALPDLAQQLGGAPFGVPPGAGSADATGVRVSAVTSGDAVDEPGVIAAVPRERSTWGADEEAAAAFLRANADRADAIVTNETRAYFVPALTGLRTYLGGSVYQGLYGRPEAVGRIPDREGLSMAATSSGDPDAVRDLCEAGVRWAWIARDLVPELPTSAAWAVAFERPDVSITRLRCA